MKKFLTITLIMLCISMILMPYTYKVQAAVGLNVLSNPDEYKGDGAGDTTGAVNIGNLIVGIIRFAGTTIAVVLLIIIGVKYMIGSVEEKAEYKKNLIPYIAGIILLFGGANFTQIIYDAITETSYSDEELSEARKSGTDKAKEDLSKSLDELNAAIDDATSRRDNAKKGTPEWEEANAELSELLNQRKRQYNQ